MGLLLILAVGVFLVKNAAVDTVSMATGRTPPSHAYRMAKLAAEGRRVEPDPDRRAGFKRVLRHWYLDACEDVDHWRAERRLSRPERKQRRRERRQARAEAIRAWARRHIPDDGLDEDGLDGGEVIDAEIVDDEEQGGPEQEPHGRPAPDPQPGPEEPRGPSDRAPGSDLEPSAPQGPPLPLRRLLLGTLICDAGMQPDWDSIGAMDEAQVDEAIARIRAYLSSGAPTATR